MAITSGHFVGGAGKTARRTVRILLYVDHRQSTLRPVPPRGTSGRLRHDEQLEFGVRLVKDLVEAQSTLFLGFRVDVLNRHYDYDKDGGIVNYNGPVQPGKHKLTRALLAKYHQVWFMGQHYANFAVDGDATAPGLATVLHDYGNRQSELTDEEVDALRDWMDDGGGVLITGDHSNVVSGGAAELLVDPSLRGKTLNLGRALGHRVPRAGQMRVWVGGPGAGGAGPKEYVDTSRDIDMGLMPHQEDGVPQTLRIARVPRLVAAGPSTGGGFLGTGRYVVFDEHALFKAAPTAAFPTSVVDILPDHGHEGAVRVPDRLDPAEWPSLGRYREAPEIVAWSRNWAGFQEPSLTWVNGRPIPRGMLFPPESGAVAAYEGDSVGVGRIVAHSTWHHMVNVNLTGFRNPDGTAGPVLDRLGTYFYNLATWLSPAVLRTHAALDLSKWVVDHPVVREVGPGPWPLVGRTMHQVMRQAIGEGPLADLLELPVRRAARVHAAVSGDPPLTVPAEWVLGSLAAMVRADPGLGSGEGESGQLSAERVEAAMRRAAAEAVSGCHADATAAITALAEVGAVLRRDLPKARRAQAE